MSDDKKTDTVSQSLDDLALIGRVEDTVELFKCKKFKMHTLDGEENGFALGRTAVSEDTMVKFDILKRATLVYAVDSINEKELSIKEKENLFFKKMQIGAIDEIYNEYAKLVVKQNDILKDLKKN